MEYNMKTMSGTEIIIFIKSDIFPYISGTWLDVFDVALVESALNRIVSQLNKIESKNGDVAIESSGDEGGSETYALIAIGDYKIQIEFSDDYDSSSRLISASYRGKEIIKIDI